MSVYALNLPLHDEADLFAEVDQLEELPVGFMFNGCLHTKFTEEGLLREVRRREQEGYVPMF